MYFVCAYKTNILYLRIKTFKIMTNLSEFFFNEILKEENKITVDEYPQEDTNHSFNTEIDTKDIIVRVEGHIEFSFNVDQYGDYEINTINITKAIAENDNGDKFDLTDAQVKLLELNLDFEY